MKSNGQRDSRKLSNGYLATKYKIEIGEIDENIGRC